MFQHFATLSPFFVDIFWAIMLLSTWKTNSRSQKMWTACFGLSAILTFIWAVYLTGVQDYHLFYKIEIAETFLILFYMAFMFFFFRTLIDERPFGWKEYLWLLPPLIIGSITLVLFLVLGEEQSAAFSQALNTHADLSAFTAPVYKVLQFVYFDLINIVARLQLLFVIAYATIRVVRYRKRLAQHFSNLEGKSLESHRSMLIGMYAAFVMMTASAVGRTFYVNYPLVISVILLVSAYVDFFLGYLVFHLEYSVEEFALEEQEADRQNPPEREPSQQKYNELAENFDQVIDEHKPYLQTNLRVSDVAQLMCTNRTYVSLILSRKYQCTFSHYINNKRVEHAKALMRENPELTLEKLAVQSGFIYATTFSRTFKLHTGMTVREWQRNYSNKP